MIQKWEINRVSTSERIFDKINTEMAWPVGIVLFGADCDLKDEVYMNCVEQIPNLATGYGGRGNMSLRAAKQPLSEGRSVLTVMHGDASVDFGSRFQTVTALKEMGAKTVVGIYAKCKMPEEPPSVTSMEIDSPLFIRQVRALLEDPPAAGEFDYLVILPEKEE